MVHDAQNAPKPSASSNNTMARPGIPSIHNIGVKLRARRPTLLASSQTSAEDTPLFMASRPARKSRRSLSPISNRAPRKKSRGSEPNTKTWDNDPACENMAWDVINKEISEWQMVCHTGRPSWWSPVSKRTQGQARSAWQDETHPIHPWRLDLDHGHRPKQRYDEKRRAVTDSYLADNSNVQDLAHLIAIQLLGACFTLPPEHVSSYTNAAYHCFETRCSSEMPDSRLISSLRMHIEARHSPSFGHQARNSSPAYRWQGAYDGPFPPRSRGSSNDQQTLNSEASREASKEASRKRRFHRALHVTEGSTADCSMDSHVELHDLSGNLPTARTNSWHRLRDGAGVPQTVDSSVLDRCTKSCPSTPIEFDVQQLHSSRLAKEMFRGHAPDALHTDGYSQIPDQQSRQTLESVIRSDPRHIYIQPVKELVIKRWRTLRRRCRYGLGYVHHGPVNRGAKATLSISASSRSTPADMSIESPALSSDGKERRRQARQSGDMNSDSIGSDPCYIAPPTSAMESEDASPEHLEYPSPEITYTRGLGVAEAIANAFADSGLTTAVALCLTPPNSLTSSRISSPLAATPESPSYKMSSGYFAGLTTANSKPLPSPPTASGRRHGQRRHQRSNLSEICTPEDTEERSVMNELGYPLKNPKEESVSKAVGESTSNTPKLEIKDRATAIGQVSPQSFESSLKYDENPRLEPPSGKIRRPSIVRTSTSGTQVFRPGEDGVELDGMPTGPPLETWNDSVQGNMRKERSFL